MLFAYSLTGPALAEAIKVSFNEPITSAFLSPADRPAFDLPHIHFEIESQPVPNVAVEIAATGKQVSASAGIPFESLQRAQAE